MTKHGTNREFPKIALVSLPGFNVRVIRAVAVSFFFAAAGIVCAHPEIEDALARLNPEIAAAPNDAILYLRRGQLYAKHDEWLTAEANYLRAAELSPRLAGLDLARGELLLATGHPAEARTHLDAALALAPRDAEAFILRARAHAKLGDATAALADFNAGLALIAEPRPELVLERAALMPSPLAAIRSLDEGIARLGSPSAAA